MFRLSARFCILLALNSAEIDKLNFIVVTALLSFEGAGVEKESLYRPSRSLNPRRNDARTTRNDASLTFTLEQPVTNCSARSL